MSLKLVKKLQDKKYRDESGLFLVEGKKSIFELFNSDFDIETVYATLETLTDIEEKAEAFGKTGRAVPEIICVTEERLGASGTFRSNNAGIAVARQKAPLSSDTILDQAKASLVLVLDDIRDPGNLGTIIRTADWFGISHIVTSETTTDFCNPKTIAASMGSFTRISVTPLPLLPFLEKAMKENIPTMGAFLEGKSVFEMSGRSSGLLIMGSESHGIHSEIEPFITERITIPKYGKAESLNVAIATAVVLSSFRH